MSPIIGTTPKPPPPPPPPAKGSLDWHTVGKAVYTSDDRRVCGAQSLKLAQQIVDEHNAARRAA